ncbi:MAG: ABC transporter ATP-binding protein [Candidatus Poribacteria bacterium]|nr:ABC transporter ATP-binding protein [Candidatus Poribacteria bacterium]
MSTTDNEKPALDTLPGVIESALRDKDIGIETVRFAARTDVEPDGSFGEGWFVLTETDVLALDATGTILNRVRYKEVTAIRAEPVVDGGIIVLEKEADALDFLRYSNGLAPKLGYIAQFLSEEIEHRQGKRDEAPAWNYKEERKFCQTCGLPLRDEFSPCPACTKKHRVLLRILVYLKPYKFAAAMLMLAVIGSTALQLVPPHFMRILVDDVLALNDAARTAGEVSETRLGQLFREVGTASIALIAAVGCLLTVHIITSINDVLLGRLSAWLTIRLTADIRSQVYNRLHSLAIRFFDKRKTGTVISHITEDSQRLEWFMLDFLQFVAVDLLMIFGIGVVLFSENWNLSCLILIPIPLIIIGARWFWKKVHHLWHRAWRRRSKLFDIVNDSISGIRVVRAFGRQTGEIGRFSTANEDARRYDTYAETVWATYYPPLAFTVSLGTLIAWYAGGLQVIVGDMSLGTLLLFHAYLAMFYGPLRHISPLINYASRALTAAERIFEVIDSQPEQYDDGTLISMPELKGEVEFRNMTFGYDSHQPVLRDINLHVKSGEMIGLVGHSGAGKSTMINLVCRFYSPDSGGIYIDGEDITKIRLEDLRRQTGVVLQEPFLFSGSIAENISYAKPDATMEEVIAAAKAANAHEFIVKFPDGYDAEVGERGGQLSGGERQRISIARAILHNPRILILDEATSSVDVQTEKKIQQAIDRLVQNRTTFAIAHRLSTLRSADRLFVIEKGRGVECGSHEELMEKKGIYFKLVETQREASEIRSAAQVVER